ncbi:hypothetical protein CYK57_00515 [Actinobacillus pleuropneumoniae]|nr:hypothetical protein CYK57_00515 [Actinobacillus pleuropneumoniae]
MRVAKLSYYILKALRTEKGSKKAVDFLQNFTENRPLVY